MALERTSLRAMPVSVSRPLSRVGCAGVVAATLLASAEGAAHLTLTTPVAREAGAIIGRGPNASLKQGPCGQIINGRTDKVSVFAPGETIEVSWDEFVNHRSYYRVAFDVDADDDFPSFPGPGASEHDPAAICPVDGKVILAYDREDRNGGVHTLNVRLPDVECENCTLQVIQYMYESGSPYYFQCADLALRRASTDAGLGDAGNVDAAASDGVGNAPPSDFSVPESCTSPLVSSEVAAAGANGMGQGGGSGENAGGSSGVAPVLPENAANPSSPAVSSGARVSGGGCALQRSATDVVSRASGVAAMCVLLFAFAVRRGVSAKRGARGSGPSLSTS